MNNSKLTYGEDFSDNTDIGSEMLAAPSQMDAVLISHGTQSLAQRLCNGMCWHTNECGGDGGHDTRHLKGENDCGEWYRARSSLKLLTAEGIVYESLLERGIDYGTVIDQHVYTAICDIVAAVMVDQYNWDKRQSNELIDELLDDLRRQPVPRLS